jgi:hypothetical protein
MSDAARVYSRVLLPAVASTLWERRLNDEQIAWSSLRIVSGAMPSTCRIPPFGIVTPKKASLRAAKKMEPTEVNANRYARLAGGRLSLDRGE